MFKFGSSFCDLLQASEGFFSKRDNRQIKFARIDSTQQNAAMKVKFFKDVPHLSLVELGEGM